MPWTTETFDDAMMIWQLTATSSGTTIASTVTSGGPNTGFIVQIDVADGSTDPGAWAMVLTDALGVDMLDGQGAIPDNGVLLTQADLGNGMAFRGPLTFSASGMETDSDIVVTVYAARWQ